MVKRWELRRRQIGTGRPRNNLTLYALIEMSNGCFHSSDVFVLQFQENLEQEGFAVGIVETGIDDDI
jgi:hypothetical protein